MPRRLGAFFAAVVLLAVVAVVAPGLMNRAEAAPTARLTFVSQVQGAGNPSPQFTLTATGNTSVLSSSLTGNGVAPSISAEPGTYVLSRSAVVGFPPPQWDCQGQGGSFNQQTATLTLSDSATMTCTARSDFRTGRLLLSKQFSGINPQDAVRPDLNNANNLTFTVVYNCGFGDVSVTIRGLQNLDTQPIPHGASCTVKELTPDPAQLKPGYYWTDPVYSTLPVTIDAINAPTRVTITNGITQTPPVLPTGTITVTATVSGATAGLVSGTTFPVTLACGTAGTFTLAPTAGQTLPTAALPAGTICTVVEGAPLPPAGSPSALVDGSYSWGTTTVTPVTRTVTVVSGSAVPVVVNHDIVHAPTYSFTIEKRAWSLAAQPAVGTPLPTSGELAIGADVTAGAPVTFSYTVANTGNSALTDVTVSDDRLPGSVCVVPTLAAGASTHCYWMPPGGLRALP